MEIGGGYLHICWCLDATRWEGSGTELLMPNVRLSEIKNLIILLAQAGGVDNELFEQVKSSVKHISEERKPLQEILSLEMFWIKKKCYPSDNNALKWSIEFDAASS